MSTYNIHAGHSPGAPGASGLLNENKEARDVKNKVATWLRNAGDTVYDCTDDSNSSEKQNLYIIVERCNAHDVDADISIHLNAGGGTGVEVLITGNYESMRDLAGNICNNISRVLGIPNRGVKVRTDLYVLNNTNAPALLVECCFTDSQSDAVNWNAGQCGNAIAGAITGTAVPEGEGSDNPPSENKIAEDGSWGIATTTRVQQYFGTLADGIVSNQPVSNKRYVYSAHTSSWQFKTTGYTQGSDMARALQKKLGATVDGWFGRESVLKLQAFLGVEQDGSMGPDTVRTWQRWLNNQ